MVTSMPRLYISKLETTSLEADQWRVASLPEFYVTRLLRAANQMGLEGKKLGTIVSAEGPKDMHGSHFYVDFVDEDGKV